MKQSYTRTSHGNPQSGSTNQQVHADTESNGHDILFLNLKNKNMLQKNQNTIMKTKTMSLLALAMFGFLVLFMVGCQKDDDYLQTESEFTKESNLLVKVSLVNEKKDDLMLWQKIIDLSSGGLQSMTFSFIDKNGNIVDDGGGKAFEDNQFVNITNVVSELKRDYDHMDNFFIQNETSNKEELERQQIEKAEWEKIKIDYSDLIINEMILFVSEPIYKSLLNIDGLSVLKIDTKPKKDNFSSFYSKDASNWTPDEGYVQTGPYASTTRAVYNRFKWNVKPFPYSGYGYEHDFFLKNSVGTTQPAGTYLSRNANSSGFPVCTWYSNMPNKYLDTRLFDENNFQGNSDEIPYTIGCGKGSK